MRVFSCHSSLPRALAARLFSLVFIRVSLLIEPYKHQLLSGLDQIRTLRILLPRSKSTHYSGDSEFSNQPESCFGCLQISHASSKRTAFTASENKTTVFAADK